MIRINQIKLPLGHDRQDLPAKVSGILGIPAGEIDSLHIIKQSVDARKKPDILYSYVVDVAVRGITGKKEEKLVRKLRGRDVSVQDSLGYRLPEPGTQELARPPVVIGTGPAGLFWAYMLAKHGDRPIVLERGYDVLIPMCSSGKAGQEHFQMES